MIRFILVALSVILFLIFSIPILIVEWLIGKKDPDKKSRQSLAVVQFMFRYLLRLSGVKVTVRGQERIPKDTAVLYVGNHRSYFDILVGYTTVPGLTGFVAKEAVVSTMQVLYAAGSTAQLGTLLTAKFTPLSAYAYLVFILLYTPCVSAVAAIRRETGSWKYTLFSVLMQLGVAYLMALLVFQLGSLLGA